MTTGIIGAGEGFVCDDRARYERYPMMSYFAGTPGDCFDLTIMSCPDK